MPTRTLWVPLVLLLLAGCSMPQQSTAPGPAQLEGVTADARFSNATTPQELVRTLTAAGYANVSTDDASRVWWVASPHTAETATLNASGVTLRIAWEARQPPASAPYSSDVSAQQAQMQQDAQPEVQARLDAFEAATGWTHQGPLAWGPLGGS